MLREWRSLPYVLLSIAVLVPCFWQPHIHAGDLSSHAYNAWLSLLVEKGEAPGLYLVRPWTNVLFDLMLAETTRRLGPDWAQRVSVSVSVLVFFWGALFWLRASAKRPVWRIVPLLLILAHGWVYQMGFFNYYLGIGLGLWACGLAVNPNAWRLGAAACLLGLAAYSHAMAAAGCGALAILQFVLTRLRLRARVWFCCGAAIAVAVAGFLLHRALTVIPSPGLPLLFGADALYAVGPEAIITAVGYFVLVALIVIRELRRRPDFRFLANPAMNLLLLFTVIVFATPYGLVLKAYSVPMRFLQMRLAMLVALTVLLYLATVRPPRWAVVVASLLLLNFSVWAYLEAKHHEDLEDMVRAAALRLPPRTRVYGAMTGGIGQVDHVSHIVDRACIGHCFSYANYEPSSAAFRLRTHLVSSIVIGSASRLEDEIRRGFLSVAHADLPLAVVELAEAEPASIRTRFTEDGETVRAVPWPSMGESLLQMYLGRSISRTGDAAGTALSQISSRLRHTTDGVSGPR